jgi:ferrous iron transport protein B
MFNLFSPPCFAAIGAMRGEMKDRRWFLAGIGLQLSVGYSLAFLVNFFAILFTDGKFGSVWMPIVGFAVVIVIAAVFAFIAINARSAANDAQTNKGSVTFL